MHGLHAPIINQQFVFLAVPKGQTYELVQLEVLALDDDCFFRKLRHAYVNVKGRMRGFFQIAIMRTAILLR